MRRAPCPHRAPRLGAAGHRATLRAIGDMPDAEHRLARSFQRRGHLCDIALGDHDRHADPAIEGARHFLGLDIPLRLQEGHQPRLLPRISIDMRRSEEHTSELQSLIRSSYAVSRWKKKT